MYAPDHSLAAARRAFWLTFAATLALKVGPRPDQTPCLVIEVGEFNLQPPLCRRRALTEDL